MAPDLVSGLMALDGREGAALWGECRGVITAGWTPSRKLCQAPVFLCQRNKLLALQFI